MDLNCLSARLDGISDEWSAFHHPCNDANATRITGHFYHYTNAEALKGILQTRTIWATHAACLADQSELQAAIPVFQSAARAVGIDLTEPKPFHNLYSLGKSLLLKKAEDPISNPRGRWLELHGPYVACFSNVENSLGQWLRYGGKGAGYRLEVPAQDHHWPQATTVRRVIYDERKLHDLALSVLSSAKGIAEVRVPKAMARQSCIASINEAADHLTDRCERFLLELAACFKQPEYADEKEWRVIQWDSHLRVRHRTASGRIVPYVRIALPEFRCEDTHPPFIRTGPLFPPAEIEAAAAGIRSILRAQDAVVKGSVRPFDP